MTRLLRGCYLATLLLVTICGSFAAQAQESTQLILPRGQELSVKTFAGSTALVLWLPSERGSGDADASQALALSKLGYAVWLADLHDSYFLQPGRASISKIPVEDIVALIDAAVNASNAPIILMSSTRGAQLALIAARQWQLQNPGRKRIQGLVLMQAYLYATSSVTGELVDYLPITDATNLPVYLLDAQFTTTALRIRHLAEVLAAGGAQVYTQVVKGLRGGFYVRHDSELNQAELSAKQDFAKMIHRAIGLLAKSTVPAQAADSNLDMLQFSVIPQRSLSLLPMAEPRQAPSLRLDDFDGSKFALDARSGKLVLVNFWASWCGPCVEEIPSLHRLKSIITNQDFEIITINMGESRAQVDDFLRQVPIDFPILMDFDGEISRQWNVYFYPSSYLLDRQGKIRYAYFGALQWDSPENIGLIQNLLGLP